LTEDSEFVYIPPAFKANVEGEKTGITNYDTIRYDTIEEFNIWTKN